MIVERKLFRDLTRSQVFQKARDVARNLYTRIFIIVEHIHGKKWERNRNDFFYGTLISSSFLSFNVMMTVMRARDTDTLRPALFVRYETIGYILYLILYMKIREVYHSNVITYHHLNFLSFSFSLFYRSFNATFIYL